MKKNIVEILRKLYEQKGEEIVETEVCKDHIYACECTPNINMAQDTLDV